MATFTGQTLKFNIEVVREKGADPELYDYSVKVPYGEDGLVRFHAATEPDGSTRLRIDFYEAGTLKFSEVIREKVHDVAAIQNLLRGAGLEVVQCADRLLPGGDSHGATWFIAAQRPPLT